MVRLLVSSCVVALLAQGVQEPSRSSTLYAKILSDGNYPTLLTPSELTLVVDGKPLAISHLSIAEEQPVALVLLIDLTAGAWPLGADAALKDALSGADFRNTLRPGDRVAIGSIADKIAMPELPPPGSDIRPQIRPALSASIASRHLNAPIWDAIHEAASVLSKSDERYQRAIVLLSAGMNAGSVKSFESALRRAQAERVSVNVVARPRVAPPDVPIDVDGFGRPLLPGAMLARLARETGGTTMVFGKRDEVSLSNVLVSEVRDLHRRFRIEFELGFQDRILHSVDLKVAAPLTAIITAAICGGVGGCEDASRAASAFWSQRQQFPSRLGLAVRGPELE